MSERRIIKTSQVTPLEPTAQVVNQYSDSQTNTYSCKYINDLFIVITGTIQMPEADSELAGSTTISYPTGLNKNNCCVISNMAHNSDTTESNSWNTVVSSGSYQISYTGTGNMFVRLLNDGIYIRTEKYREASNRSDITFRLVLMKLPTT